MVEIWKDIEGYEGIYQVSNLGRVKSLNRDVLCNNRYYKHLKGQILKGCIGHYGYLRVSLCSHSFDIHVLVARAFLDNPLNYSDVNHKDENKLNNRIDNLEYCTKEYNNNYGTRNARLHLTQINDPRKSIVVEQIDLSGMVVAEFPSISEAARTTGICENAIRDVCNGRPHSYTAGGYRWRHKK